MKAFDGFLDQTARDNKFDFLTGRPMSREMDASTRLQLTERVNDRQRVTVASNYFAIACPIMPLGILACFSFLEKIANISDKDPAELEAEQQDSQRQRGEITQALYIAAMKKKLNAERDLDFNGGPLKCSRPVDDLLAFSERKQTKKRRDVSLMLEGQRSERLEGQQLLAKGQPGKPDISKLVKAKMQLQSHLESLCEEQDFGAVCRVSARLELLDKALKKLIPGPKQL